MGNIRLRVCWAVVLAAAAMSPHTARSQEPGQPLYTLHVYNNLVQFATLVLEEDLSTPQPVPRKNFDITLDGGPAFHPTQMRREGDDRIDLAVLLDVGGSQKELLTGFGDALASLAPAFLHANDRLSIYAADCTLMRSLYSVVPEGPTIKAGADAALNAPGLHGGKAKSACGRELHLWDYLTMVSAQLASQPGRRVILLLSDGDEDKSKTSFVDASRLASGNGTAVFLMHDVSEPRYGHREHLIENLVSKSGGMVLDATSRSLAKRLQDFVMLLRGRYILEFPRPDDRVAGRHQIVVTVPGRQLILRYTGATTPLPDAALAADPFTLPSTASPAKVGTHKPLN